MQPYLPVCQACLLTAPRIVSLSTAILVAPLHIIAQLDYCSKPFFPSPNSTVCACIWVQRSNCNTKSRDPGGLTSTAHGNTSSRDKNEELPDLKRLLNVYS